MMTILLPVQWLQKADYLVTGDSDLLDLKSYKRIETITPEDTGSLVLAREVSRAMVHALGRALGKGPGSFQHIDHKYGFMGKWMHRDRRKFHEDYS